MQQQDIQKDKLLTLSSGEQLSEDELNDMHNFDVSDTTLMDKWVNHLEKFKVFYSSPLDIDFMMLETIGDKYTDLLGPDEGPKLTVLDPSGNKKRIDIKSINKTEYVAEFNSRVSVDVAHTLKKEGGDGLTYSETQRELMIWYNYFFLSRGKPTTHLMVLSRLSADELKAYTPDTIKRMIDEIQRNM